MTATKLICDERGRCQAHADGIPVDERCPGWCDACGQWPYATEVEEEHGGELSLCHGCAAEWHTLQAAKVKTNDVKEHHAVVNHAGISYRVTFWTVARWRRITDVPMDYLVPPAPVPPAAVLVGSTPFGAVFALGHHHGV